MKRITLLAVLLLAPWITNGAPALAMIEKDYNAAVDLVEAGKHDAAKAAFTKVLENSGNEEPGAKILFSRAANNLGSLLLMKGEGPEAAKAFQQAIDLDPENAEAIGNIAMLFLKKKDYTLAQKVLTSAIKLNPANSTALYNMGLLMNETEDPNLAINFLLRALEVDPGSTRSLALLLHIYVKNDATEKAANVRTEIKRLQSHLSDGQKTDLAASLARYQLSQDASAILSSLPDSARTSESAQFAHARVHLANKAYPQAVELLKSLRTLKPNEAPYLHLLAAALIHSDQASEAIQTIRLAMATQSLDEETYFLLGLAHEARKEWREAEKAYLRAVKINPKHGKTLNNLGSLHARQQREAEALDYFKQAVKADPKSAVARYNYGKSLVISMQDYELGVIMLVQLEDQKGPMSAEAGQFIKGLENIKAGKPHGWNQHFATETF